MSESEEEPESALDGSSLESDSGDLGPLAEKSNEAEAICAHRIKKDTGLIEYLIKWKNCKESENTWEIDEKYHCPELISQHLRGIEESLRPVKQKSIITQKELCGRPKKIHGIRIVEDERAYLVKYFNGDKDIVFSPDLWRTNPIMLLDSLESKVELPVRKCFNYNP